MAEAADPLRRPRASPVRPDTQARWKPPRPWRCRRRRSRPPSPSAARLRTAIAIRFRTPASSPRDRYRCSRPGRRRLVRQPSLSARNTFVVLYYVPPLVLAYVGCNGTKNKKITTNDTLER